MDPAFAISAGLHQAGIKECNQHACVSVHKICIKCRAVREVHNSRVKGKRGCSDDVDADSPGWDSSAGIRSICMSNPLAPPLPIDQQNETRDTKGRDLL